MRAATKAILIVTLLTPVSVLAQEVQAPSVSIHFAALQGNTEAIDQHIEAGSDLNARDPYGSTPLIIAATFGKTEVARALIEAGADLDMTSNDGATALHASAFLCHAEIVEALLDGGANKHLRNNFGSTALESVSAPFEAVEGVYDTFSQTLGPLGLELDYEYIRVTRPVIADLLRPRPEELKAVEYTPLPGDDWKVSTPAEQGLDPKLLTEAYLDASSLPTLYGMLVIKNGHLIAEAYFNEGGVDQLSGRQSATKSFVSALVGIALARGCLSSVDQKMVEFFPEHAAQIEDPRKQQITIRHLLQMRAGYPDDDYGRQYLDRLFLADNWHWTPHLVDFPLLNDPGTEFAYSSLSSHLLAIIVARTCDTDLHSLAQETLFTPIGAEVGDWTRDADNYNWGWGEIYVTGRDMAKFGSLYLNGGEFAGAQVLSFDWVNESLTNYSESIKRFGNTTSRNGRYLKDLGYGYQWWSATAGAHRFDYAAGHGGSLIILLHDLDMVIVTTADPLYDFPSEEAAPFEGPIIDMVGRFIASLPTE